MHASAAKKSLGSDPEIMLVVEDEEPSRRALLRLLQSLGYDVHAVGSAEEALQLLEQNVTKSPHWMVVDVDLPGMCGLDLVRMIKAAKPEIHSMLVTGADKQLVQQFCNQHAVDYFPKPLDISRFLKHIKKEVH
jgi:CheY-like chemotaxis protein